LGGLDAKLHGGLEDYAIGRKASRWIGGLGGLDAKLHGGLEDCAIGLNSSRRIGGLGGLDAIPPGGLEDWGDWSIAALPRFSPRFTVYRCYLYNDRLTLSTDRLDDRTLSPTGSPIITIVPSTHQGHHHQNAHHHEHACRIRTSMRATHPPKQWGAGKLLYRKI
jgi:hypothetical protein